MQGLPTAARPLLIHAHPGHELRLHHWMEENQPTLMLLTDGAGGYAAPRTLHSAQCAKAVGAQLGALFGTHSDRDWYDAILSGDMTLFDAAVEAAVTTAWRQRAPLIVTDAVVHFCLLSPASAGARLRARSGSIHGRISRQGAGGSTGPWRARELLS